MYDSIHGLLELLFIVHFNAAFVIPTRNKEYHDTFYTLCRGALLYPQISLAIFLNSTLPLVWGQIPSFTKSCRALSNTIKSAHCNRYGQRPLSSCQPIPRHYDRYPAVHALQDREITASQPLQFLSRIQPDILSGDNMVRNNTSDSLIPYRDLWLTLSIRHKND